MFQCLSVRSQRRRLSSRSPSFSSPEQPRRITPTYRSPSGDSRALRGNGAIIPVVLGVSLGTGTLLTIRGETVPARVEGAALIDTGASITCIDEAALVGLGLLPTGTYPTSTTRGRV